MAHGSGNLRPDHPIPRVPASRPNTSALFWIVTFLIVAGLVAWGIRLYGTRSSAEGSQSLAAASMNEPEPTRIGVS